MSTLFAMGDFGFGSSYSSSPKLFDFLIGNAIIGLLGVIAGLVIFFVFMSKKNEGKFTGFLGWLYDFLHFKVLLVEGLLKALYAIAVSTLLLTSLYNLLFVEGGSIGLKFLMFIATVVFGNVAIRLLYEFLLFIVLICKNTSDINKKLKNVVPDKVNDNLPE